MSTGPIFYKSVVAIRAFAGVAKPNPKMGQALGPLGINMMQFCKQFNSKTSHIRGDVPMRIKVFSFSDRSYVMRIKPPDTAWFLKRATGLQKFSSMPSRIESAPIQMFYVYEIAKIKKELDVDLQHFSLEDIIHQIMGQLDSCGLYVISDSTKPEPFAPKLKI